MKYQLAALALAGSSYAALEGYGAAPPAYGAETTSTSAAPSVPAYGGESSSTSAAPTVPAYGSETTSSVAPPVYGQSTSASTASDVTVTDVVSSFTTYCPEATTLTHGGKTYTVSSATTLTLTSCPGGCEKTESATATPSASTPNSPVESSSASVPGYGGESSTSAAPSAPGYGGETPSASASTPNSPVQPSGSASVPAYGGETPSASKSIPVYGGMTTSKVPTGPTGHPVSPYGQGNSTVPAATGTQGSPSASGTFPAAYTGAASKVAGGAFLGLTGLLSAFFL